MTVTARKIAENIMQVPLAISALNAEAIESKAVVNLSDLANYAPGLSSEPQGGVGSGRNDRSSQGQTSMRGLSVEPVLLFIDGAPLAGSAIPEIEDLERVEVLKGPQNAYFGRSTFTGAINFVTKDPSLTSFQGFARAQGSSFGSTDDMLSLEGPIVQDVLALRVVGHYSRQGGQYVNAYDTSQRLGEQSTRSVTAEMAFHPNAALKIKGYVTFLEDDDGPPAQYALKPPTDLSCNLGGTKGPWYCGQIPNYGTVPGSYISAQYTLDPTTQATLLANTKHFPVAFKPDFLSHAGFKRHAIQSDITADWNFADGWDFGWISSYDQEKNETIANLSFREGYDVPNPNYGKIPGVLPYTLWLTVVQGTSYNWSQELRVSSPRNLPVRFVAGANYLQIVNPGGSGVYGITPLGSIVVSSAVRTRSSTPAVFGGIYYDVLPKLTLSGELRYQWDKIRQQAQTTASGALIPGGGPLFQNTYTSFAPRVTVDYKYAANSTVYALWSRGTRPGGFNAALAVQPPQVLAQFTPYGIGSAYQQETIDNFEAGLKSSWLDGRIRTVIDGYKEYWRNGQVPVTVNFTLPSGGVNLISATSNLGKINLEGIEFQGDYKVTSHLLLSATYDLAKSEMIYYTCGDCKTILGKTTGRDNQLPQAPKYHLSLSGQYTDRLKADWDWYTNVDYTRRGPQYIDYADVASVGPKDNVNLRLGVLRGGDRLKIEGFVTNLTNNKVALGAVLGPEALYTFAVGQEIRVALPDQRMWGLRVASRF